ncbi:MAG: hypothetical protein VKM01_04350 [Cyanobacteriota bacterium]|nr:hypothetical protein [Cyanobacteriota bacterium]
MARWWRLPTIPVKPLPMLGLAIGGLVWAVAITPRRQPLEGALQATGVSFAMAGADRATPTGVLVVAVRALSIRGPADGDTLALPFSNQTLALTGDSELNLQASAAAPLGLALALPAGTRVEQLQPVGDALLLELVPPTAAAGTSAAGTAPLLRLTAPEGDGPGGALTAVLQEPGAADRRLSPPQGTITIPLAGPARLRLQLAAPRQPVPFEPNLPVRAVAFTTTKLSLFDGDPIRQSTLRGGRLHLGRLQPLDLRADQFLQLDPPGITVITDLRAQPGQLALEVVGHSRRLRTGLSYDHPTTVVQGTLLSRHLPPEQISGFYGFLAGVMGSLVLMLFKAD